MDPLNIGARICCSLPAPERLSFQEDTYATNPVTGETVQIVTAQVTVYPTGEIPTEVPDWANDDELFQIGVAEGWIIVVSEQSALAAKERAAKKTENQKDKMPVGLTPSQTGVSSSWKK